MAVKIYQKTDRIQLSKNFKSREFRCGLGRPCSCPTTLIDDLLVLYLQKIRDYFGAKVTITSAYRCPSYNSSVGGATGSYHTRGQAADIVVEGVAPRRVAAYAEYIGVKGIGLYETAADGYFVHIDTRTTKSFWYGQGQTYRSTFGGAAAMGPGGGTSSTGAASDGDYSLEQFIRDVQAACGAAVDGVAGSETLGKTVTLSASKNIFHAAVLPVQRYLLALGYTQVGSADGVAGPKFAEAVKAYQEDQGGIVDGEITAKAQTWQSLLGL